MINRLRQVAAEIGLPFGNRTMTYNSRLAQEMGVTDKAVRNWRSGRYSPSPKHRRRLVLIKNTLDKSVISNEEEDDDD